jgi:metal-responsive CopG/Arc/MetJ family transcriptional regulator
MRKRGVTKEKLSITINKQVLKKFNDYCDENSINKSDLLEKQIKKFLEEKGVAWQEK